jgi:hypothetical protein
MPASTAPLQVLGIDAGKYSSSVGFRLTLFFGVPYARL